MSKPDPAADDYEAKPRSLPGVVSGIWKRGSEEALSFSNATARGSRNGIGVASLGADSRWLAVNPELGRMLGRGADELRATTLFALTHPEDRAALRASLQRLVRGDVESFALELRCSTAAGELIWLQLTAANTGDAAEGGYTAFFQDIGARRRAQDEAMRTAELLEATLANIQDGVALLDAERRILVANRAYAELFALNPDQLVGLTRDEFVEHVVKLAQEPRAVRHALTEEPEPGEISSSEVVLRLPQRRCLQRTLRPVGVSSEHLLLVVWRDVTPEKDLIAERERELFTDALTGIASRRAAQNALHRELAKVARGGAGFSVALFDLDHFKSINDRFGHPAGDVVLQRAAAILATVARATDVVARWGGEEFIAIISADLEGACTFCERARLAVADMRISGGGRITLSAGVTNCRAGESAEIVVARADRLLYAAKHEGRNRVIWEPAPGQG
jgi:diguanylate cyclase (GGDEF)-like protein/PAS domain S-box-containing protein